MDQQHATMGDIVADNAERFPDVTAYRDGRRAISHRELLGRSRQLISAMVDLGVRRGDRVGLLGRNSIEFGEVLAATALSGITLATISFRLASPEVLDALRRVTPSIVFCDAEFAPLVTDCAARLSGVQAVVVIGGPPAPGTVGYEEFIASGSDRSRRWWRAPMTSPLCCSPVAPPGRRSAACSGSGS